jgi:hypothetical protein
MSLAKLREIYDERAEVPELAIPPATVLRALEEAELLATRIGHLQSSLEEALEAIGLHEIQARARRDTADELEWRSMHERLSVDLAMADLELAAA